MRWRWLLSAVALVGVGCASDPEPAATEAPTTAAPVATAPPTTVAPTTTVQTTTTTLAPTTTAAPTTTLAPTTTIDPLEQLAAEIERDLNLGEQALLAAFGAPDDAQARADLDRYFSGPALTGLLATLDAIKVDGLRGRANPDVESRITMLSVLEMADEPEAGFTLVQLCRVDAGVIYEPLSDGGEIVVNDRIRVAVTTSRIARSDGVWVLDGGDLVEERTSEQGCNG